MGKAGYTEKVLESLLYKQGSVHVELYMLIAEF